MESSACRRGTSDAERSAWSYSMTPECAPVRLKEEPAWGECGVSEAAAAEGLYAAHEVKDELVIGPEQIQQQDIAFLMQNPLSRVEEGTSIPKADGGTDTAPECTHTCPGDGPGGNGSTEQQHGLRSCYVRLQRLPVADVLGHDYTLSRVEEVTSIAKAEDGTDTAPECTHTCPGDGPGGNGSTEQQHGLRSCYVRLQRLPVDLRSYCYMLSRAEQDACKLKPAGEAAPATESTRAQSDLTTRRHKHTGQKPHSCDRCHKQFPQKDQLTSHLHISCTCGKPYCCDICNKQFNKKSKFSVYKRIHTAEKRYNCNICNKGFGYKWVLKSHMRTHTGERPYKCDICNKLFTQQSTLSTHIRLHTGEKPYVCDICNKGFAEKSSLSKHVRTHTGEKPYSCDICNKLFTTKSTLSSHIRTHTGEKPYKCDICNKLFTQQSNLSSHIRTHTGEKPYKCDICNKLFTHRSDLSKHMRTHTSEKPYKCDVCNKLFTHRSSLSTHMRIHTGEKPYICDICKKGFAHKSTLTTHVRRHTGEKPFSCKICNKLFSHRCSLARHKRTHTDK